MRNIYVRTVGAVPASCALPCGCGSKRFYQRMTMFTKRLERAHHVLVIQRGCLRANRVRFKSHVIERQYAREDSLIVQHWREWLHQWRPLYPKNICNRRPFKRLFRSKAAVKARARQGKQKDSKF